MIYEIDRCYDFRVLPGSNTDDFFKLEVETPTGKSVVHLPRLQFQKEDSFITPAKLNCRVKNIYDDGVPVLSHVVTPYVFALYEEASAKGESFECEVVSVPAKPSEEPFMLRDRYGIFYRLNEPGALLSKGQIIRCKFVKLLPRFFQIARVDEGAKLPYYSPEYIFDAIGTTQYLRILIEKIISSSEDLAEIRDEIATRNPLWLLSLAKSTRQYIPKWFMQASLPRHGTVYMALLDTLRNALLFLLEGSGFLNAASSEHRRTMRQQLTESVESIEPYDITLKLIVRNRQNDFVESILDKLQKSGYLYHPAQQFAVLTLIFRLYPDKVGNYLSRIFESIFGRDLENWKREPFRSAFVEQFRIYVRQARREIDELPLAETREEKTLLETIITAIALQLILSNDNIGLSRSWSLFYRYVSLLRPLNNEALLSKSFLSLLGAEINTRLDYRLLKEPMIMMTQATVMPPGDWMSRLKSRHRYSNGSVDLTVSSSGIQLAISRSKDTIEHVIPDGLMEWLRPQILLSDIKSLSGSRLRKLPEHNQWWHDIETSLFNAGSAITEANPVLHRRHAEPGDQVYVVIDSTDDFYSDNPTFVCHIEDEEYEDGAGTLRRDQIVGYNLKQPAERVYRNTDGSQLGFLATVLDIRSDGSYIFSLRNEIDRYIEETFNFEDDYIAIIAGINERDYSAISSIGVGLFLEKERDIPAKYRIGDIVVCRMVQIGKQGQIRAYIKGKSECPEDRFDKIDAFSHLMHAIGESGVTADESAIEDELICDFDEMLSPDEVREIIEIIRFKAIADSELIKAYDYLRFARVLALLIGDSALAAKLGTHASLLALHQYYATNSRIDPEKLDALKREAVADPFLKMIYYRLEMVSWLDKPDRISELYRSATKPSNELEGSIARMVLSHNMLRLSDSNADSKIASEIKQQIMAKLNVNNETRRGKYYGSESKYLEFKTSIVYPATAPGDEMREDPEAQQFHILSRIAGMLNASGGKLYIGVNNDGFGVGLHDDFKYYERRNAQTGNYTFRIKSVDNMCVFLENLVNNAFGESVGRKISISSDDEDEKDVILIDIKESLEPVFLDKRLFVRQSGQSTREYHGNAIDDFVREREELKVERAHMLAIANTPDNTIADTQVEKECRDIKNEGPTQPERKSSINGMIQTSKWRPNVLHNYESGYADPMGYIYFIGDNTVSFSSKDLYLEPGHDDCRLALVIPHGMSDSFLILAFDNERAMRIPVSEIIEKGENIQVEYNNTYKLMFATIATKNDGLLCVGADSSGALWQRVNKIGQIEVSHLMSQPKRMHEAPIHHTVAYELVEADSLERFADCMSDRLASKRFGTTMRIKEKSPNLSVRIEQLINSCHAQD